MPKQSRPSQSSKRKKERSKQSRSKREPDCDEREQEEDISSITEEEEEDIPQKINSRRNTAAKASPRSVIPDSQWDEENGDAEEETPANTSFKIKRFDPCKIRPFSTVLFAGGRRSGKSTVMREIMSILRKRFYEAIVYTGTNERDHPWSSMTPAKNVKMCLTEFPEEDLEAQLNIQRERIKMCEESGVQCPPTLLVFEDLEFLKDAIWNNQSVRSVWFNGRWSATYAFCAFQYIMEIKMALRNMFDYAFFMMDPNIKSRERIYQQYCGIIPNKDMFENIFKMCTTDYRAMVVDLRSRSYNLEDSIFWYKADPALPPFRVGVADVWNRSVDEENVERKRRISLAKHERRKTEKQSTTHVVCSVDGKSRRHASSSKGSANTGERISVRLMDVKPTPR